MRDSLPSLNAARVAKWVWRSVGCFICRVEDLFVRPSQQVDRYFALGGHLVKRRSKDAARSPIEILEGRTGRGSGGDNPGETHVVAVLFQEGITAHFLEALGTDAHNLVCSSELDRSECNSANVAVDSADELAGIDDV